jgi:hypothetical protein
MDASSILHIRYINYLKSFENKNRKWFYKINGSNFSLVYKTCFFKPLGLDSKHEIRVRPFASLWTKKKSFFLISKKQFLNYWISKLQSFICFNLNKCYSHSFWLFFLCFFFLLCDFVIPCDVDFISRLYAVFVLFPVLMRRCLLPCLLWCSFDWIGRSASTDSDSD